MKTMKILGSSFGIAVLASIATNGAALAQSKDAPAQGETVLVQPRGEFEPLGVRAGSFLVFPLMQATEEFDTNVYSTEDNERADLIHHLEPSVKIQSDWRNHSLNFSTGGDIAFYTDESDLDYKDYNVGLDGRLDIQRGSNLRASAGYNHGHEATSSPDSAGGVVPAEFERYSALIGGSHQFNRIKVRLDNDLTRYDYHDSNTSTNGVPGQTNNDDRDRNEWTHTARIGYEVMPEYEAFVSGQYRNIAYLSGQDDFSYNRDSKGWAATAGVSMNLTGLLAGDIFGGYIEQTPDDSRLPDTKGPQYGFALTWTPTGLTTVSGNYGQAINQTTIGSSGGTFETSGTVRVDHELRRNILLNAVGRVTQSDFTGTPREDTTWGGATGVRYLLNRNFYASLDYDYTYRNSNAANSDFNRHQIFLRLGAQL